MITITNEDNMVLMARYPDKHFDLAIVDPPYGIGVAKTGQIGTGVKFTPKNWDENIPTKEFFNELKRVSKNQIIWGVNYFDGFGLNGGRIVWNKLGKSVGHRKVATTFSECELAYYSGANNIKMFSYTYIGNVQGNDYKILWSETNRIHPTQKPIELYKWLLENYAKPVKCKCEATGFEVLDNPVICDICNNTGNVKPKILDTHLGSGSIAIACHDYGFDLTACELDKDYYEAALKRLNNHMAQKKLELI